MPMRIAEPLLSLLGHELRAPVGVIGGYLGLLEQSSDELTPSQAQAVAGARRAQQSLVDALDDLRRLTVAWRIDDEPLTWVAMPLLVTEMRRVADARRLALTVTTSETIDVPRRGRDAALAEGLVTVAEAVSRERGVPAHISTVREGTTLVWQVRHVDMAIPGTVTTHEFDPLRPGLGVRLVAAVVTIAASGGRLVDLRADGESVGVDVVVDLHASASTGPALDGAL